MTIACQTVSVAAPAAISGVVTDGVTGAPIAGATVVLKTALFVTVATVTTDSSGNYSFTNINAGTYEIDTTATGYTPVAITGITATAGAMTVVPIHLYTPALITATNMTMTPLSCLAPCNITVSVTWTNQGETTGAFTPNLTIDGVAVSPAPYPNEPLTSGASVTHAFTITNLAAGNHSVCPIPN